jgi:AraC family transcriptional regulator
MAFYCINGIIAIDLSEAGTMSEIPPLTVDFTRSTDVLEILPRPPLRSSENLGWNGIYVQQHQQPAWEIPTNVHTRHMVLIHSPAPIVNSERWFDGRKQQEQFNSEKTVVLVPARVEHRSNWDRESHTSLLFLEPDALDRVARELVTTDRLELIPQYAMHDPLIDRIGRSLTAELATDRVGNRMFADSLTIALSIHLIRHYSSWQHPLNITDRGLSPRKLQQAIDYIDAHLHTDLSVSEIATELAMSQYYFTRLFKRSLGISPYQYVMQQRIERAKYLLKTTGLSMAAIARQVGFANQNQLTFQFRKFVGTTPSNYRK